MKHFRIKTLFRLYNWIDDKNKVDLNREIVTIILVNEKLKNFFKFYILSYQKFETNSYCVGVRHHSSTLFNEGDETKTCQEFLFGKCVQCNERQSLTVSNNTVAAEGLGNFFKTIGKVLLEKVKSGCQSNEGSWKGNRTSWKSW